MEIEGLVEQKKTQPKEARKSEIKAKGRAPIRQGNRKLRGQHTNDNRGTGVSGPKYNLSKFC